jgi:hypothetical protein
MVRGLKRTCYAPDWHRDPDQYNTTQKVYHDEENKILIYVDSINLGQVISMKNGQYIIEHENIETGTLTVREYDVSLTISQIRQDRWWAE